MSLPDLSNPPSPKEANWEVGGGKLYPRYHSFDNTKWYVPNEDWKFVTNEQCNICMDLAEADRFCSTKYGIPIEKKRDIN